MYIFTHLLCSRPQMLAFVSILLFVISKQICNKAMYDTRERKAICSIFEAEINSVVKCSEMNVCTVSRSEAHWFDAQRRTRTQTNFIHTRSSFNRCCVSSPSSSSSSSLLRVTRCFIMLALHAPCIRPTNMRAVQTHNAPIIYLFPIFLFWIFFAVLDSMFPTTKWINEISSFKIYL